MAKKARRSSKNEWTEEDAARDRALVEEGHRRQQCRIEYIGAEVCEVAGWNIQHELRLADTAEEALKKAVRWWTYDRLYNVRWEGAIKRWPIDPNEPCIEGNLPELGFVKEEGEEGKEGSLEVMAGGLIVKQKVAFDLQFMPWTAKCP